MKCNDVKELLAEYWDLSESDPRRDQVNDHIEHCSDCAEEFVLWEESSNLIQTSSPLFAEKERPPISNSVMDRIYADESWRMPVPDRIYSISYKLRRNLTAVISFCLALFMIGFLYSIVYEPTPELYSFEGLMPVASAVGDTNSGNGTLSATLQGVPVASISDPFILGMNPIKTYPDYMVVISLLGIVIALLIMNWFSRIKA
jgi:hypothetical protein